MTQKNGKPQNHTIEAKLIMVMNMLDTKSLILSGKASDSLYYLLYQMPTNYHLPKSQII